MKIAYFESLDSYSLIDKDLSARIDGKMFFTDFDKMIMVINTAIKEDNIIWEEMDIIQNFKFESEYDFEADTFALTFAEYLI